MAVLVILSSLILGDNLIYFFYGWQIKVDISFLYVVL